MRRAVRDDEATTELEPEPECGGFYAAPYSKHGLTAEILPGGTGTPTVQMAGPVE